MASPPHSTLSVVLQQAGIAGGWYTNSRHGDDEMLQRQRPVGYSFFADDNIRLLEQERHGCSTSVLAAMECIYIGHAASDDSPAKRACAAAAVRRLNKLTRKRLDDQQGGHHPRASYFAQYTLEDRGECVRPKTVYDRRKC